MSEKDTIIVTGAGGNLGSHIVKSDRYHFIPVRREKVDTDKAVPETVKGLIHCAYDLKKDLNVYPKEVLESNIVSVGEMLAWCVEKGIKTFVFISSCSVYGELSNSSEEKPCTPITMNGFTKNFGEELVKSFCVANGMNYIICRVFNSYGGEDKFSVLNRMIESARTGVSFNLANEGIAERDFIHVKDVASIICQLIEKNLTNEIVNVGSGVPVRVVDILKAVENKFGKINVNHTTNNKEILYSRANVKKLKSLISYEFTDIFEYIRSL